MIAYAEDKARDALAFDPLPQSRWVRVDDKGIVVAVRYSEALSGLLRKLPGARREAEHRRWRFPFTASDAIRGALPEIDRLANLARERDRSDRMASTIRHNRARGKHAVAAMSDIVVDLVRRRWSDEKIAGELGMDRDEVLRLKQVTGLAEMFADREFSEAWEAT